ncbi:MAG: sugar phosphate isomerase/epimerase [Fimbriimonadaceae bacterium]|nr:sugar phosphate isomerase/epimerase [Fimbriimonadaceae bacterium]
MKLALLSFDIAKGYDLPTLLKVGRASGFSAVELRMQLGHSHGVDLHLDADGRRAVRDQCDDALLEICGIGVSNRFEYPDPRKRQESIDEVKRYIELAADLDAYRVRVFGNDMPKDPSVSRQDVLEYVADSLTELAEFAAPLGIEVNLEMHGQFNWWRYALRVVQAVDLPNVGIVYNCDPRDVVGGSVSETFSQVAEFVHHVHMHELDAADYPYREFLDALELSGYQGYMSAEIRASSDPDRVLGYYGALYRALRAR